MKLTEKQKRFADYYIETGNATESAIRAGYSKKTATETGYENLRKPHILEYVGERTKKLEDERTANMKEVREFWSVVMRDNHQEMKDRLKASEFIAKTKGAFIDKVEHSGGMNNTNVELSSEERKKRISELKAKLND